ncbi:iron-containing alcohol dehydrogenase-domain containing protein [Apiospora arundinis]
MAVGRQSKSRRRLMATASKAGWPSEGGWYRFVIMAALAVCAIVALAVGLTLGLRQRNKSAMPSESGEEQPVLFPAGSYAFKTALLDVADDCTSNNATFRCYPFKTYNQSKSDASATYFWIITQVNSWAYQISAASNPFVPQFSNLSLTQLDANQFNERLTFSFSIHGAAVVPTTALGEGGSTSGGSGSDNNNNNENDNDDNNNAATCYYNDMTVTATIWTRRPAEFPTNLTTPVSSGGNGVSITSSTTFEPWPYAVQVVQRTRDTPDCRDVDGNRVGGDLVPPPDRAGNCTCSYANFDL